MKIWVRIFLGYFLVVGLAAWQLFDTATERLQPALRQSMEDTLIDTANLLAEFARDDLRAGNIQNGRFAAAVNDFGQRRMNAEISGIRKEAPNHRVYVTDLNGRVVFDSDHLAEGQDYSRWNDVYLTLRGRYGARTTRLRPEDKGSGVMHVAAPIRDDGKLIGVVTVAKPASAIQPFIQQSFDYLARMGMAILAGSLLLGLVISWWLTRSLTRLTDYARAVSEGQRVQLPKLGGGEVSVLGRALQAMRQKLEGRRYVEEFVVGLTHELKSPLAAIRGAAELIGPDMPAADQARFLANIRGEAGRLTQIVDRLLELARLEQRQALETVEAIPVSELIDEVLAAKQALLTTKQLKLALDLPDHAEILGERFLLRQALSNLIDNAIDFAPAGSQIELSARVSQSGWEISVADHGPGIPDYAQAQLFDRFYSLPRPDSGRKSTGLGLALVREIAKLHDGEITVDNRDGGGAVAVLRGGNRAGGKI
ncbi:two-component system sensor histidine kinase CreC [Parachitinimonas caeni]|uniref:histidine kinase n=1 Tax=Parachitinimonas caeni TaxID=3031301 RepID=A0ABT7E0T0_9NEIS|nr:two-component system sensor histidine kinase CreC [Parachitinimonas caeni]MDK2125929.1 two-component system sensor histidine kinase CreC [Parachitinimonas caeni]